MDETGGKEVGWRGKMLRKQYGEGTNTREDKCEKWADILVVEKYGSQTIATICKYLQMVVKVIEFSLTDCPCLHFYLKRAESLGLKCSFWRMEILLGLFLGFSVIARTTK